MKTLNIHRKFERMFPGIAAENKSYDNDQLSDGKTVAEHNRKIKNTTITIDDSKATLL